ncbi:hypothetical protein L208DRAFT_1394187 [Tricholoma matsutake]|nr:hypothetical protein L208DRAFT_1394187 [Tricholoma matsutake 945]
MNYLLPLLIVGARPSPSGLLQQNLRRIKIQILLLLIRLILSSSSKMGLDFCSAPASLVDDECAFSVGRLEINYLQHNTSPQTFKAQVAVGSWAKTPLYPGLSETIKIVQKQMESEEQLGPQKEVDETELEEEVEETDDESRFWRT